MTEQPEKLLDPGLASTTNVAHGFFTRRGGVSDGLYASLNCGIGSSDDRDKVLENRARAAKAIGAGKEITTPFQVHGADVAITSEAWPPGEGPEADGIVTSTAGLPIGIGTADCAPVLFAETEAGVVAAAHAGWGGAIKGVLEATVAAMATLGAEPKRIVAAIGPAIAQKSYEVGPEFRDRFIAEDPANHRFFAASARPGRHQFDLIGHIVARLERLGLQTVSLVADTDTYTDEDRFFSFRRATHRKEADYGRMISAIALA